MNQPLDMSRFIEAKSDQLNADDLIGAPRTITITKVTGSDGDQPVAIFYEGDNGKPFKPCKTIRRVLMGVWGRYADEYVGKSMTLYRDNAVTFGGLNVGGIRISHMSHIDKDMTVVVMKSKGKKAGMKILPLRIDEPARQSRQTPEQWVEGYEADVAKAGTLDALVELQQRAAKAIEKLKAAHPGLHERAVSAGVARAEELAPSEGRTDEQHGDQFDGSPFEDATNG